MEINTDIIKTTQEVLREDLLRTQDIPRLILKIIEQDNWRLRKMDILQDKEYTYFPDFVQDRLPYGLDTDWKTIQQLIKPYPEVELAVAKVLTNPNGVKFKKERLGNLPNLKVKRTKAQKQLQKLEKDRPDLFDKVKEKEITVNAAMIEAGFKKPPVKLKYEPESIAKVIKDKFTPEEIAQLVKILIS